MTIPKLAQKCGLSDNTVRRYVRNYPQFFQKEVIDGWEQYPAEESLKLISKINAISAAGKRRSDVMAELMREFEVVESGTEKPDQVAENENINGELMITLKRIADSLEKIALNRVGL